MPLPKSPSNPIIFCHLSIPLLRPTISGPFAPSHIHSRIYQMAFAHRRSTTPPQIRPVSLYSLPDKTFFLYLYVYSSYTYILSYTPHTVYHLFPSTLKILRHKFLTFTFQIQTLFSSRPDDIFFAHFTLSHIEYIPLICLSPVKMEKWETYSVMKRGAMWGGTVKCLPLFPSLPQNTKLNFLSITLQSHLVVGREA